MQQPPSMAQVCSLSLSVASTFERLETHKRTFPGPYRQDDCLLAC